MNTNNAEIRRAALALYDLISSRAPVIAPVVYEYALRTFISKFVNPRSPAENGSRSQRYALERERSFPHCRAKRIGDAALKSFFLKDRT